MTPDLWLRVRERFDQAIDAMPKDWATFLESIEPDETVRNTTLELLANRNDEFDLPDPEEDAPLGEGHRVGRYAIERLLGRGGMAAVYLARDPNLDRWLALKVLPKLDMLDTKRVSRFRDEARSVARLQHENIATVYTFDVEGGHHYLAMEYLPGGDLQERIVELRRESGEFPVRDVARLGARIAHGLQHAHDRQIVHRDITPRNLMFDAEGEIQIVDFGLAHDLREAAATATGTLAGTPQYMSPEQAHVLDRPIDHRTDVYSLGAVLYEMLTLAPPHEGTPVEVFTALQTREPASIRTRRPNVPRDLETIVHKALETEPADRYESAAELAADLERFLRHEPILGSRPSPLRKVGRWVGRHRKPLAVVCALAPLTGVAIWSYHEWTTRTANAERYEAFASLVSGKETHSELTSPDLAMAFELTTRLRAEARGLDDEEAKLVRFWEKVRDDYRLELRADAFEQIDMASGDPETNQGSMLARLEAENFLRQLSLLFPQDELAVMARDPAFLQPKVSLRAVDSFGNAVAATARVQRIDLSTTQPRKTPAQLVGSLPRELPVEIGYNRFTIVFQDGSMREFDRLMLDSNTPVEIVAVQGLEDEGITGDMIQFGQWTDYATPEHELTNDHLAGRTVQIAPYAIDATEVSNGDYQEFLDANPQGEVPRYWDVITMDRRPPDWDDFPVTGLSWIGMRAYAEWRGKRLPTFAEWDRAARGENGNLYPWGNDADDPLRANVGATFERILDRETSAQEYLDHVKPVRSHDSGRTAEGAYNMYGNVEEFTGSIMVLKDTMMPVLYERIYAGHSWRDSLTYTLAYQGYTRTDRRSAMHYLGFRCAKSLQKPK